LQACGKNGVEDIWWGYVSFNRMYVVSGRVWGDDEDRGQVSTTGVKDVRAT
jgi:hypothetical protein